MSVTIRNIGSREGDEVVQVYEKGPVAGPAEPIHSLRGFRRVHLRAGEEKSVVIPIPVESFRVFREALNDYVIEPGKYELQIGASSADIRERLTVDVNE